MKIQQLKICLVDDIDMIPDLEKEEVETVGENIFESRVLINMNPSLITIPDDFKDDKELLIIDWRLASNMTSRGLCFDITVDIIKRKTVASEVVFSEAIVLAETFAYHKLIGHESGGSVRRVGSRVTSNQLNAKCYCQSRTEPLDCSIVSLILKEVDDVE
ncbi:hypothetical protein Cgig2_023378 [Carnegiea gigantea]|uniref:Uncharacterized protein n=1 Tax=Carnegiea gigantea TaxID=171969 RepID=A0A9Q1GNX3_9CARY|nr:hypothetical protein Cgig2_023378 [Carnegiea gigantea]